MKALGLDQAPPAKDKIGQSNQPSDVNGANGWHDGNLENVHAALCRQI
ncbi:MAG: hypothetical protein RL230_2685 [Pseudomonadota bacterium]|jgi:hypothetical protein